MLIGNHLERFYLFRIEKVLPSLNETQSRVLRPNQSFLVMLHYEFF